MGTGGSVGGGSDGQTFLSRVRSAVPIWRAFGGPVYRARYGPTGEFDASAGSPRAVSRRWRTGGDGDSSGGGQRDFDLRGRWWQSQGCFRRKASGQTRLVQRQTQRRRKQRFRGELSIQCIGAPLRDHIFSTSEQGRAAIFRASLQAPFRQRVCASLRACG